MCTHVCQRQEMLSSLLGLDWTHPSPLWQKVCVKSNVTVIKSLSKYSTAHITNVSSIGGQPESSGCSQLLTSVSLLWHYSSPVQMKTCLSDLCLSSNKREHFKSKTQTNKQTLYWKLRRLWRRWQDFWSHLHSLVISKISVGYSPYEAVSVHTGEQTNKSNKI